MSRGICQAICFSQPAVSKDRFSRSARRHYLGHPRSVRLRTAEAQEHLSRQIDFEKSCKRGGSARLKSWLADKWPLLKRRYNSMAKQLRCIAGGRRSLWRASRGSTIRQEAGHQYFLNRQHSYLSDPRFPDIGLDRDSSVALSARKKCMCRNIKSIQTIQAL